MSDSLTPLDRLVRERIATDGPLRYADVVELALYDEDHGFYATGGRAGRRGDFLTSPEVGPLFGALVAEAIDREWERVGRPDPFTVVDAGAGPGTLARTVRTASPRCGAALEYVAVERSEVQRRSHPDGIRSVAELPAELGPGLVVANELLDNMPFAPAYRVGEDRWVEAVVDLDDGRLAARPGDVPVAVDWPGVRDETIIQGAAAEWLETALSCLDRGSVIVFDYWRTDPSEVGVRTYRGHSRGADPLEALGTQDITCDVDLAQLAHRVRPPDALEDQSSWLAELGLESLVEEGRQLWEAGAATGGLAALRGRSRVREAEALTDRAGLGAFTVAHWVVG